MKVTDRRMFTPDGELRPEYQDLMTAEPGQDGPRPESEARKSGEPELREPQRPTQPEPPREQPPAQDEQPLTASFQDLVALLAQSASMYLSQASSRLENRAELLELARMHIDLMEVVKRKTVGNLAAGEQAMLDDALYQLRMAFVEHG